MQNIDLSPAALKERKQCAKKATRGPWKPYNDWVGRPDKAGVLFEQVVGTGVDAKWDDLVFIADNCPDAIISMINEIESLRAENAKNEIIVKNIDMKTWKEALVIALQNKLLQLEKEADWLANEVRIYETMWLDESDEYGNKPRSVQYWRKEARKAVKKEENNGNKN